MLFEKKISVVVPAFKEEHLIVKVLETMPDFVDMIYVIDDCSPDATSQNVETYCQTHPRQADRIKLIKHEKNRGVGGAINSGYIAGVKDDMNVMAVMAGDNQMDPAELEKVVGPVACGEADYVKGNRLFTEESWRMPRYRFLGSAILSLLTKIATGYWHVADSQCGYTAISKEAVQKLPLGKLYPRYGYPNHLLAMLNIMHQRVKDVPVRPIYGVGEVSGIRLHRVVPTISKILVRCFFWRLWEKYVKRDFHPLVFFYLLGLVLTPLGIAFGTYLAFYRIFIDNVAPSSILIASFLIITGLQSTFFAMLFDMENNKHL